jgi:hypothetical protein
MVTSALFQGVVPRPWPDRSENIVQFVAAVRRRRSSSQVNQDDVRALRSTGR